MKIPSGTPVARFKTKPSSSEAVTPDRHFVMVKAEDQ